MSYAIRIARADDAPALARLLRELGLFSRVEEQAPSATLAQVTAHLEAVLSDDSHLVLLAETADGTLVGYAAVHWLPYLFLEGPEGFVSELFVAAPMRGEGIGSQLLERVVAEARTRGCSRLMLSAVRSRESYIRGFYTKRGWAERADVANMVLEL